ncbi:hypothetical protein NPIL_591721 [Nephila pilipes]|uniref:Uncharacterized protein n=1 Tax=Nephila pilipes TaxID=299642 RepID=A0A8X6QU46_NEPPI|nr:hypothetical protein NPIL_591721 [Nephila pilipes]
MLSWKQFTDWDKCEIETACVSGNCSTGTAKVLNTSKAYIQDFFFFKNVISWLKNNPKSSNEIQSTRRNVFSRIASNCAKSPDEMRRQRQLKMNKETILQQMHPQS